tara:strand:- start:406 stop:630 length:225 start_codon:yes stop_codon:yes gene_type:complete
MSALPDSQCITDHLVKLLEILDRLEHMEVEVPELLVTRPSLPSGDEDVEDGRIDPADLLGELIARDGGHPAVDW